MKMLGAVDSIPTRTSHNSGANERTRVIFDKSLLLKKGQSIPIECNSEEEAGRLYNSLYLSLYSRVAKLPLSVHKRGLMVYVKKEK